MQWTSENVEMTFSLLISISLIFIAKDIFVYFWCYGHLCMTT